MRPKPVARLATAALAAALLAAGSLAACGGEDETAGPGGQSGEPFELALDFYVNPDHAGILTGVEGGFFERAGLDVDPQVPSDPSAPIRQVAAGQVDLAISYEPELLLAREQGLPVVAVGALVAEPLTSVISLPSDPVEDASELEGKTVATAGIAYQDAFLEAILADGGVPPDSVEQVDVGFNLQPALLAGRAEATLGAFANIEGVELAERGEDPIVRPVDELGVPTYDELILVASEERLESDPARIEAFLGALEEASQAAAEDPERASELVVSESDGLDPRLTLAQTRATLPLLAQSGERWGEMDPGEWEAFAEFMADRGLISEAPPASDLLTNDLLPD
ncbi:ABC transporter substrate-binding protein [Thermoleophilia bacterium SCSIO 60948]|nr:ABC transporter substrate-binding protein [Thermoleophilia bacterium SCSIO 60948]